MLKKIKFYSVKIKEVFKFTLKIKFAEIKVNENILIYGFSRGGTTLLAETLVGLLGARLIWEPLFNHRPISFSAINPYALKEYRNLNLGWNPHVADPNDQAANNYFDKYFNLKIRNIRFLRFTNPANFKDSQFTVHKMCFGNFMYPYFQKRYRIKSILLLRHPFAIAASSLNFGNNYDYHKENFKVWRYENSLKSGAFFEQYDDKYDLIVSPFTLLVFQSVTQFAYVLNNFDKTNTIIICYEDLMVDKDSVHKLLEQFLNQEFSYENFDKLLNKQSFSSKKGHTKNDTIAQLSKWEKTTSEEDIINGIKIFEAFDFKMYSRDVLPNKDYHKEFLVS